MNKLLFLLFLGFGLVACKNDPKTQEHNNEQTTEIVAPPATQKDKNGEQLARLYCSTCHIFPEPGMLTKETWRIGVMPSMGPRMGIFSVEGKFYPKDPEKEAFGVYPKSAWLNEEDWKKLLDYYFENAPDQPVAQFGKVEPKLLKGIFKAAPNILQANQEPSVSLVKIDPQGKRFFIGHMGAKVISMISESQDVLTDIKVASPPSSLVVTGEQKDEFLVSNMGTLFPNNQAKGVITRYTPNGPVDVLTKLQRPVKVLEEDLDNDGIKDLVVCNYGHITGKLSWHKGNPDHSYQTADLKNIPGAIQAWAHDMDGNGYKDLVVLFAQNEEQVVIFYNMGNGVFKEKQVLVFPSVYGSSYMELADFNKDGKMDLLVTNGDNADVSIQLKYFHGLRIYMNNGKNEFKESYFYPMYGAFKAMARDFDQDGDLDIAAIAYFPDYSKNKPENFVFLKNDGKLNYQPFYIEEANEGHWIAMDAGDLDADGDVDLILGNFVNGPTAPPKEMVAAWQKNPRMFLILKNSTR